MPAENYSPMVKFRLRLRVRTENALGVLFANSAPDEELAWLPVSEVVVHNEWMHDGELFVSGKMPRWLAKRVGLDLGDETTD